MNERLAAEEELARARKSHELAISNLRWAQLRVQSTQADLDEASERLDQILAALQEREEG
jgi:predicted esterase